MMTWVPNAKTVVYDHSQASYPYGPGSKRTMTLNSGMSLVETILISDKPTLLAYCIPRFGFGVDALLKNYQGRMHFESIGPSRTRLAWSGYFDCPGIGRLFEPLFRVAMRNLISTMAHSMQRSPGAEEGLQTASGGS